MLFGRLDLAATSPNHIVGESEGLVPAVPGQVKKIGQIRSISPRPLESREGFPSYVVHEVPWQVARPPVMRVHIPSMEEMFLEQLRKHPRKGIHSQDLTQGLSITAMMEEFGAFMSNQLASGTWSGYGTVWTDFLTFASQVHLPICEYSAALFLRRRMLTPYRKGTEGQPRYYLVSTIYHQSKSLLAIGNRLQSIPGAWNQGFLHSLNRILVKMGAKVPTFQAQPLLKEQVYKLLNEPAIPEDQKILLFISWKCAGRADDMSKANTDDVEIVKHRGVTYVILRWRPQARTNSVGHLAMPGSGCPKNLSNGIGFSCVLDCGVYLPRVLKYLASRKGLPLSPYTTEQVTAFLKKHISPIFSAHSIKRGALQYLLEQGVDLRLIAEMARHTLKLDWLPMVTKVYLQSALLALATGTQRATKLL